MAPGPHRGFALSIHIQYAYALRGSTARTPSRRAALFCNLGDGDGLITSAEFSGPQGRVPRAWALMAELERTTGGAWLSARQRGAARRGRVSTAVSETVVGGHGELL